MRPASGTWASKSGEKQINRMKIRRSGASLDGTYNATSAFKLGNAISTFSYNASTVHTFSPLTQQCPYLLRGLENHDVPYVMP